MKFTVLCVPSAEQQLAAAWLSAPHRQAVSDAAFRIERTLEYDPENQGESREDGRRILFSSPLGVRYVVDAADMKVLILQFWRFDTHDH